MPVRRARTDWGYPIGTAARFGQRALALGAIALVSLVPAGQARPGKVVGAAPTPPLGGVNLTNVAVGTPTATVNREIAWARSVHAHVIRTEIPWSELEPSRQGQINTRALALTDQLVGAAAAAGIRVVALVQSTPCWASSAPPSLLRRCKPEGGSEANAWPPLDPSAYGAFVASLVGRYGVKLAAIEVWNEPDQANQDYFAGPDKPRRYAAVLRAAYVAIKRVNPNVTVLGGSLVGSNGAFLRALYKAGIKGSYDGLSVHFYNLMLASLRSIHEVQVANGDSKPVWLNEFGWSSCWPRQRIQQEQGCVTAQAQAANLSNAFRELARTPWVAAEIVYELQGSRSEDFGVLSETGAHKPSFGALSAVLASPFGNPSPVTLRLRGRNGRVVASGSGPVGDYMQLEAFRGRRRRYRALFTLNRFNRYSIPLPRALGTHGLRVSVFQYWMGTARAARGSI